MYRRASRPFPACLIFVAACEASSLPKSDSHTPNPAPFSASDRSFEPAASDTIGSRRETIFLSPELDDCRDLVQPDDVRALALLAADPLDAFEAWRQDNRTTIMASGRIDCLHRTWRWLRDPRPRPRRPLGDLPPSAGPNLDAANGVRGYQGETAIAIDPLSALQLVAGANSAYQDPNPACQSPTGGASNTLGTLALFRSIDGGSTWSYACAPWPPSLTGGLGTGATYFGSDPAVAYDANGNAFASYLLISQNRLGTAASSAIVVAEWPTGGSGWQNLGTVVNHLSSSALFDDKPLLAVDTSQGGAHSHTNRLYVIYDENGVERVAHSDGGTSWTTVVVGSGSNIAGNLAIGSDGTVYAVWNVLTGSPETGETTVFSSSTDGGTTWTAPRTIATHRLLSFGTAANHQPPAQNSRGINAFPAIAVDTRAGSPTLGRIFVVYADFPSGVTSGADTNIYEVYSDLGTTWSAPVLINDDGATGATQFLPWVSVDESDSWVNVAWYDTRNFAANNRRAQIYYAHSSNGGVSFSQNANLDTDDSGAGFVNHVNYSDENSTDNPSFNANQYGDYLGIAAANHTAHIVWTDTRNFYPASGDARIEDLAAVTIQDPDFSVVCLPSSLTAIVGRSASDTCTIGSFGMFNGPVTLSCSGAPAGVSCAFAPNPVTPPANGSIGSALTVSVAANTVPGTYTLTVTAVNTTQTHTTNLTLTVTACGDRITEAQYGETCDNGTNTAGSGCSPACQIEPRSVDLATTMSDRRFIGSAASGQSGELGNVAIGDVNGDGIGDLIAGESAPAWSSPRLGVIGFAGVVHGYLGSSTFFNGASTTVPTGEAFQIRGPDNNANLGGGISGSSLFVADVTGDGIADILAGAPGYNGAGGGRPNSGAIYCIQGQASLANAGLIDLSASTLPAVVRFTIVGARTGDFIHVMGAGDIDRDGVADIIVGAPGASNLAGTIYVVSGTGTGTIDLLNESDPNILAIVRGYGSGDMLGELSAAIGDVTGDGIPDLAVSSPRVSNLVPPGAGGVAVIFGPVPRVSDLSMFQFNAAFVGEYNYDGLGQSIAIGQVRGDSTLDLVIGVRDGWNDGTNTLVGYVDVWTGPIAGGITFLSNTTTPGTRIYGRSVHSLIGHSLSLGDLNNDGYVDLVIGAPGTGGPTGTRTSAGEMTVIAGAQNMAATIDLATLGPQPMQAYGPVAHGLSGHFARNVAAGDLDGDGKVDYAVGTPFANGGAGQIDVFQSRW